MKNSLKKILSKFNISEPSFEAVENLQWKAQEASSSDILFYRLSNEQDDTIELMEKRLAASNYGVVVINTTKKLAIDRSVQLEDNEYFEFRDQLADVFYPIDLSKNFIAITGTNGKTTTVDIISQLLAMKSMNCLTIGTLGARINREEVSNFGLTSPDYIDLRKTLYKFRDNYDVCAIEASSHAIDQRRLGSLRFNSIGWTSFSQDHLDYHHTMEEYFEVKKRLQNYCSKKFVISSLSDELSNCLGDIANSFECDQRPNTDFFKSQFNQVNLDVALGCLLECGYDFDSTDTEKLVPPPGRFNTFKSISNLFVIDFAHTPDALENICKELKSAFRNQQLVCIFGCGGNRDKTKRALMGSAASKYCDYVILTSDNPRFEVPDAIISDIEKGVQNCKYEKIIDREQAIIHANRSFKDSVILIAGKGHEPYIDINGEKIPYSDELVVKRLVK